MIPLLYSFIDRFQLEFRQHNLIHPAPAVRKNKFRSLNNADQFGPKPQRKLQKLAKRYGRDCSVVH